MFSISEDAHVAVKFPEFLKSVHAANEDDLKWILKLFMLFFFPLMI